MAHSIWDAVGQTPLIYLQKLSEKTGCHLYGKAEFLNPGGSVKDRAAKGMIFQAEEEGKLKPGGTLVEGTAGNTGIGLATLAAERGYKVVITMPNTQSREKIFMLEATGAKVTLVDPCPFSDERHFYHRARAMAAEIPNSFWVDQFENPANSNFHYKTTGPEIWEQMRGRIDFFVSAVGTGGTIGGVSRFLKEKDPSVKVIAADPLGSGVYKYIKNGKFEGEGSSVTEGIGIRRLTRNLEQAVIDDALQISDKDMIDMLFELSTRNGLFVGPSSALNVFCAYQIAMQNKGSGRRIVTILCDHGSRYASRILNSTWQQKQGLTPGPLKSQFT